MAPLDEGIRKMMKDHGSATRVFLTRLDQEAFRFLPMTEATHAALLRDLGVPAVPKLFGLEIHWDASETRVD